LRQVRGWRRSNGYAELLRALEGRQLDDLERCRIAWEGQLDPVAVCAAVVHSDLPPWLTDALLVLLSEQSELGLSAKSAEQWEARKADMLDRARAEAYASALTLIPELKTRTTDTKAVTAGRVAVNRVKEVHAHESAVGDEAIKASHRRVRNGLKNPGRYYLAPKGLQERVLAAWDSFLQLVKSQAPR
jgi:hypothetical protein